MKNLLTLLILVLVCTETPAAKKAWVFTETSPQPKTNDGYDPNKTVPPGYVWRKVANEPWKLVKDESVSEVTPSRTFRTGPVANSSHSCPSCGTDRYPDTYIQRGAGPVPGTHLHSCPNCATAWYH